LHAAARDAVRLVFAVLVGVILYFLLLSFSQWWLEHPSMSSAYAIERTTSP